MKRLNADEIRESYLKFFESKEHLRLPSFSLVPDNDPTLLLIGAGMAPFKSYFKGEAVPPATRVTTCQKCVRVGDIEQVGRTNRHHTFFEMLGNFSFGDYFKKEAITWGWEYVTKVLCLPADKIYVTIHTDDDVAEKIWIEEVGFPKERIYRLEENFWGPIGNTGPCGPCSEILVDQGEEMGCGKPDCKPGCDCDRYLEIWNLVFTGLNKNEDGKFEELPKPCIDTGLGFERLVAYFQGEKSAYETEIFEGIINKIKEISGKTPEEDPKYKVKFRVISDHVRSVAFMACDGITPSNEGRGYVMRRLIRRSVRFAQDLGFGERSLTELVEPVVAKFGHVYPELKIRREFATSIISTEEENFRRTLNQGVSLLDSKLRSLEEKGAKVLPGEDIFTLYDTYGFPYELTTEIAAERNFEVDLEGYRKALEEQRERARSRTKAKLDSIISEIDLSDFTSEFTGRVSLEEDTVITAIFIDGAMAESLKAGQEAEVIFAKTCFYGESGGQTGDTGILKSGAASGVITDTRTTPSNVNLHRLTVEEGEIRRGDNVKITVDTKRRQAVMRHHTATHLLQGALRIVLGSHVGQLGSLVDQDRLRFDFSHHQPLTGSEIIEIERLVNSWILDNVDVNTQEMPVSEALKTGALAFFGEKYGDRVRVVSVPEISTELCGGTHVTRTGDIGSFKITSESAIGMGTRRIEAVCGMVALERFQKEDEILRESASFLNTDPFEVIPSLKRLWENVKKLEKELKSARSDLMKSSVSDTVEGVVKMDSFNVLAKRLDGVDRDELRQYADMVAGRISPAVIVLGTVVDDRVALLVRLTDDLVKKGMSAVPIIKEIAPIVEGSGGGNPRMAQAGGRNPEKLDESLQAAIPAVENLIRI